MMEGQKTEWTWNDAVHYVPLLNGRSASFAHDWWYARWRIKRAGKSRVGGGTLGVAARAAWRRKKALIASFVATRLNAGTSTYRAAFRQTRRAAA